jgi:hypothetical protein
MIISYNESAMNEASILSGFSMSDLQDMIDENPSLRGYLQGYLAERSLKKQMLELPDVSSVKKIPDRSLDKGDFEVVYKGVSITVEVKSVATASIREDLLTQNWQGSVLVKNTDKREVMVEGIGTIQTTKLTRGQFDILAICCFAVSGKWDFMFIENRFIPSAEESENLLKTRFTINPSTTPGLTYNLIKLLEKTLEIKAQALQLELLTA